MLEACLGRPRCCRWCSRRKRVRPSMRTSLRERYGLRARMGAGVRETVKKQVDAGVDVLNDGEVSKPSYATYVKDRLTGFGGEGSIQEIAASVMNLEDF